jgi:hypothetical protein
MAGAKENHDPVTWLCELQQVGADPQIAVIPGGSQVGTWLIVT